MGVPDLQRHEIDLGAMFPGVVLPCVYDPATGRIWFPIATTCALLELDTRSQRARAQRDYAAHVDTYRLPTAGGPQELLCIEREALALWIATAQEGKAAPGARDRLRRFRRLVMAGATAILTGKSLPVPFDERPRGRLAALTEARVAQLERAVFVGDPEESETFAGDSRTARCPHCGGALRVTVGTLQIAPGEE